MTSRRYTLEHGDRPWTTNAERKLHHMTRARRIKEWREAFFWLSKQASIPRLVAIEVTAEAWQARGVLMDTAACNPAVKAAIDGIVDAGVIPDDTSTHVTSITFLPTQRGRDALVLTITEVGSTQP